MNCHARTMQRGIFGVFDMLETRIICIIAAFFSRVRGGCEYWRGRVISGIPGGEVAGERSQDTRHNHTFVNRARGRVVVTRHQMAVQFCLPISSYLEEKAHTVESVIFMPR